METAKKRLLLMAALSGAISGPIAVHSGPADETRPEVRRATDLSKDKRLAKHPPTFREVPKVGDVIKAIGDHCGVPLMVQGEFITRQIGSGGQLESCDRVLAQLADLFGGAWYRSGEGYVLLTRDVQLSLLGRTMPLPDRRLELATSLTKGQRGALERKGRLKIHHMLPRQATVFTYVFRRHYLARPADYPSTIAAGEGCWLELRHEPGSPRVLAFVAPKVDYLAVKLVPEVISTLTLPD